MCIDINEKNLSVYKSSDLIIAGSMNLLDSMRVFLALFAFLNTSLPPVAVDH